MSENQRHFNSLTPAELERLALVNEECAEVQQIISKIIRHGFESTNPLQKEPSPTNKQRLETELGDLRHGIDRLIQAGDVNLTNIALSEHAKACSIARWLHHQGGAIANRKEPE